MTPADAEAAGRAAALNGEPSTANPHPQGSPDALAWRRGHAAVLAEREIDEQDGAHFRGER